MSELYRHPLALLTDLYELTMAQGYWRQGMAEREAVFHLTFRRHPFHGQYAIACGLAQVVDYLRDFRFGDEDLRYLASIRDSHRSQPLFAPDFLQYLSGLRLKCDIDAIPEGTVVFQHEPLVRVCGPLLQSQMLETALLTMINFPTLVATKAARICRAARGEAVLEFGLRRAQGIDGGLTASRAAFVGGCTATSNVLAGKLFDIPIRGTHAHSWVMAFDNELEAFAAYADAMPNNCVFLVDTYDTEAGVRNAIRVAHQLRARGHEMVGVRLDSGDLAELSRVARKLLDEAGFEQARIVASSDLDEHRIEELEKNGARIDLWGVGTRLATAFDEPALGGVYKLAAIRDRTGGWSYRLKLSEQVVKVSDPGLLDTRRYEVDGLWWGDAIYNTVFGIEPTARLVTLDDQRTVTPPASARHHDLLVPITRAGKIVYQPPTLTDVQQRCREQLKKLPGSVTQLNAPSPYLVGRELRLDQLRAGLRQQVEANHGYASSDPG